MEEFDTFINKLDSVEHQDRVRELLTWIEDSFPQLEKQFKWNQPMFADHGTFIIGFSTSKNHLAVAPEQVTMNHFAEEISAADYEATKQLFRIKWNQPVNYDLLKNIIQFNIEDKADYTKFWRS